jgi:hypothetical protein
MALLPPHAFLVVHLFDSGMGEEVIDVPMDFLVWTEVTSDPLVETIEGGTDVPVPASLELHHPLFSNLNHRRSWEFDDEKIRPFHKNRNVETFL